LRSPALRTRPGAPGLIRVLGFGLSIALAFGGCVGTGILRLPGTVAQALGDPTLIVLVWALGGLYATFGAVSVAELAAMMPTAGGFYVYARRTFGPGVGFVIGWNDWLVNCLALASAASTASDFIGTLHAPFAAHSRAIGISVLGAFTGLHWLGIRIGSRVQSAISATVGILLVVLAIGCFTISPAAPASAALVPSVLHSPLLSLGMLAVVAASLRSVIFTYDGWYQNIYNAEETVDASRTLPRALIGTALLVTGLYVLVNVGFLHALPLSVLAASTLPAADAAREIFPHGAAEFVTVVSLLAIFGIINAVLLSSPRILFALGRDGLLLGQAASVSAGGTPRVALALTGGFAAILLLTGTLQQLVAVTAVVFVLNYLSAYVSIFILRIREPQALRPYRALGFPWTSGLALVGSVVFLVAGIVDDPRSGIFSAILIAIAAPSYWWASRRVPVPEAL
jgi:APA family basic amino acid/polyamine antiporter